MGITGITGWISPEYQPIQLILIFWGGIGCGANRFEHLEVTLQDEVIKDIFSWERMPGSKNFQRYFQKFSQATNERVFDELYGWFFDNLHFDNYTLDIDSTVMTRYGEQEGAKRGYNPQKKGRKQHHPLLAFISDLKMIANLWLRAGNTEAALNFVMMPYNLMNLFRQVILGGQSQPFLKTIRCRIFAIEAYFIKDGNSRILKLSLAMKRRTWFMGLWNKSSAFECPFSSA